MSLTPEQAQMLGEIKGIVGELRENQRTDRQMLAGFDTRLRDQEVTAAKVGAFSGGAIAIGVALIIEGAKQALRAKGGGSA